MMSSDDDLLYHGSALPNLILESGMLKRAELGYRCVSLSRCPDVAKYFATLEREGLEEEMAGTFVFRRADLISAGYKLIPFHDPLFGKYARDEQEEQVWGDIPLNTGLLLRVDRFPFSTKITPPPLFDDCNLATEGPLI